MSLVKAINVIRNFIDWRNGAQIPEPISAEVTEALEIAINSLLKEVENEK